MSGKDLILHIIGKIGVDGALYKSMEFTGPGVASLTMEDRLCMCNMAIEAGAKNGIFPVDETTKAYLKGRSQRTPVVYEADPDAEYEQTIEIDLDQLEPTVGYPHLPENTHPASEGKDIQIDQVVIGTCTNGRLEDMEAAYNILKGRQVAKGVRCIIIPATMADLSGVHAAGAGSPPSSTQAASSPPPPAAPASAATWASWPRASGASPPPTATLWAAWAM